MKMRWLRRACAAWLIAGTTFAQSPYITSFHGNGRLTWTNSDTNLFYCVEWAPSLATADVWLSSYGSLSDIRSSDSIVTSSVPMFYRVSGSSNRLMYASPVPKTGQTNSYQPGDDGYYTKGVAWPNPRFTVQADTNCVTDNMTGLVWARNANLNGRMTWSNAIVYCEALNYGGQADWHLPNERELKSLIHSGYYLPALCNTAGTGQWTPNNPFRGVQGSGQSYYADNYWSSTTVAGAADDAWSVDMAFGGVSFTPNHKMDTLFVWPVRGGQ